MQLIQDTVTAQPGQGDDNDDDDDDDDDDDVDETEKKIKEYHPPIDGCWIVAGHWFCFPCLALECVGDLREDHPKYTVGKGFCGITWAFGMPTCGAFEKDKGQFGKRVKNRYYFMWPNNEPDKHHHMIFSSDGKSYKESGCGGLIWFAGLKIC